MRFLTITDTYPMTFKCCRYASAAVKADPALSGLVTPFVATVVLLKAKMSARQEAEDHIADAQGAVAFCDTLLREGVLAISRKVFAHFGSRLVLGYLKILPKAASDILKLPAPDRAKAVAGIIDALAAKGLPAELSAIGKELAVLQKNYSAATAQVTAAELAAKKAKSAESDARGAVVAAYRTLHAQLTLKFPTDKARVARYFWSPPNRKAAKAAKAATGNG